MSTSTTSTHRTQLLQSRIRLLVAIAMVWNTIEAAIALIAGGKASSAALIGFGLDSVVEVLSAAAVAWQFAAPDPEKREKTTLRIIAISFFALAAYVIVDAALSLLGIREPEHSTVGIALAAASMIVMPILAWLEHNAGKELGSATAMADAKQRLVCSYLSIALLVGLVLNSLLGWGWADSVAALVISVIAIREGLEAWGGDACCATPITKLTSTESCCGDSCGN